MQLHSGPRDFSFEIAVLNCLCRGRAAHPSHAKRPPLSAESPERIVGAPRAEPLPQSKRRKPRPLLEQAVTKRTHHQRRKAEQALAAAVQNGRVASRGILEPRDNGVGAGALNTHPYLACAARHKLSYPGNPSIAPEVAEYCRDLQA